MDAVRTNSRIPSAIGLGQAVLVILLFMSGSSYADGEADKLYAAVDSGDLATVEQLIAAGVDVNAMSSKGSCALHAAAVNNNPDLIVLLLENGADPNAQNSQGDTALICATKYAGGHARTVKLLLAAGTDPDVRDKKGNTALDYAKSKKQAGAIAALEEASK